MKTGNVCPATLKIVDKIDLTTRVLEIEAGPHIEDPLYTFYVTDADTEHEQIVHKCINCGCIVLT